MSSSQSKHKLSELTINIKFSHLSPFFTFLRLYCYCPWLPISTSDFFCTELYWWNLLANSETPFCFPLCFLGLGQFIPVGRRSTFIQKEIQNRAGLNCLKTICLQLFLASHHCLLHWSSYDNWYHHAGGLYMSNRIGKKNNIGVSPK